jgi:hypothetical protein
MLETAHSVRVNNETGSQDFHSFFVNKNSEFNISTLKGLVNIVAYIAKTVPAAFRSKCILD